MNINILLPHTYILYEYKYHTITHTHTHTPCMNINIIIPHKYTSCLSINIAQLLTGIPVCKISHTYYTNTRETSIQTMHHVPYF